MTEMLEVKVQSLFQEAANTLLGRTWDGPVPVEVSNRRDLGDYASALAFQLARPLGITPLETAEALVRVLVANETGAEVVESAQATAPAFVNVRVAKSALAEVIRHAYDTGGAVANDAAGAGIKCVIEHTNVNPNKAAHLGHLRNACLGDTVARLLARRGFTVEVQNYIDDTGVQVADVVVGLRFLDSRPALIDGEPFDRYCSRVYTAVRTAYDEVPDLQQHRLAVQRALEQPDNELQRFAIEVTREIAACNLATMARAGVSYDLLTWESDILRLGLWDRAFELLVRSGAIHEETSGPNAGTWVLPFGQGTVEMDAKTVTEDKVIVTGDGIATYTAKDIAYQLWKFGLLGIDFSYMRWAEQEGNRTLWTTTTAATDPHAPKFAEADRVINVIDVSQSYPQQVVYESLRRLGFAKHAEASEHLAYGIVSLTPTAARELGLEVSDDSGPVAMKGRAGVQVFADDLLDRMETLATDRGAPPETARAIAVGAARYYMLKYSNPQDIAFDFEDALKTTGESGVYLQYAYTRASSMLRKLPPPSPSAPPADLAEPDRALCLRMADYPRVMHNAANLRSPSAIAKYGFDLASAFSTFYDNTPPVVAEKDAVVAAWRGGLVGAFQLVMGDVLDILGIPRLTRI